VAASKAILNERVYNFQGRVRKEFSSKKPRMGILPLANGREKKVP